MEELWLEYAKRLQALASTGAAFTRDQYDRERYDEIAQIAMEMMARIGDVPVCRIEALIGPYATGYMTPKVDVRGVVFENDRLLLVKEKSDGKWALPGGFADVGLSPAENISKEILEEAGLVVDVAALIGVRHKSMGRSEPDSRDFYKLFFACNGKGKAAGPNDPSIADHAYFGRDTIPDLSTGRTTLVDIEMAFDHLNNVGRAASFH
ncbi:NUDIX hydrolase [Aliiroseovarius sp. 2305UL8-7]|uniref:NUDIX hydrolase n=1 Tax=Aliiroseovarius conchicola TaxID=3121637 RepID=UPI003528551D